MISFEEFKRVDIRVGRIIEAGKVPDTDKLLKLLVDFGPLPPSEAHTRSGSELVDEEKHDVRIIVSGIAAYFPDPAVLVNQRCMFVVNLEPRIIRGIESQGMILALSTPDGKFSLLSPGEEIPVGTQAK